MSARILVGKEGIEESVKFLRSGEVVGLPTETVYGLAGDAFQPMALARIFEAKGRPLSDPLIVHLPEVGWIERVVVFTSEEQRGMVESLAASFWPGPLTLLLPKHPALPDLVTSGSERVAVRVTSHPLFREILHHVGSPLAAPSANRFGRISPTSAGDVMIELGDRIPLILDDGPCQHGMESTIVAIHDREMEILRPGPITSEELNKIGRVIQSAHMMNTPGSLPGHYAPKKRLQIVDPRISPDSEAAYLSFSNPRNGFAALEVLSRGMDLREAASNFYGALRRLDQSSAPVIYAEPVPETGIGVAIMDRLRRAAQGSAHGNGDDA